MYGQQQPPRYGNQQGFPPQQQMQPQYGGQPQYGAQQSQYGNQQPQYGQQNMGWQQQQPPAQYPCCPEDPNEHFCNTDPNQQPAQGQQPSMFVCLWQQCDATTWLVLLMFVSSILGFGLTVGLTKPDNLLGHYDVEDAAALQSATYWDNLNNVERWLAATNGTAAPPTTPAPTPAPLQTVIVNGTRIVVPSTVPATTTGSTTASPTEVSELQRRFRMRRLLQATSVPRPEPPARECRDKHRMLGTFGVVCAEDSLEPLPMLMNQSRWLNFRGTLYFLAMMGCLTLLIIIVVVNKQKASLDGGGNAMQQQGQYGAPPVQPPYAFHGTELYYVFRMAWGTVAVIVFFWMVTELYQYWWFIGYYKERTTGKLNDFWRGFDKKFVPSTICVGLFLCWPIVHLCLELAFFIVGFIPWWGIKQCYQQMQAPGPQFDEEKAFDDHSCCIRTHFFYSDFKQAHRLGFSEGQWKMLTGSREPFCRALECQQMPYGQQGYGGGPNQMGGQTGMYPNQQPPPRPGESMSQPQQQPSLAADRSMGGMSVNQSWAASQSMEETPRKKDKKEKKEKKEKNEKKEKKDKKDKKRRGSGVSVSRSFAAEDSN